MEAKLSILAATIAATLLATVVQADEAAIKAVTKCAEDNKIQMESLMKSCDPATDLSTVPGFKCFTKCAQQFMGVCPPQMDDAGKFDPAKSAGFVAEEDRAAAKELAEACGAEANAIADLCDRAFAANACMAKKSPEMYKKSCMAIMNKMMSAS